ncbi:hypothetical protein N7U49_21895 [Streptomyces sp. AD2-2]|nr:hypothetical protein N7U49_21895 [Streptomyces sp. AD2-2]
MLALDGVGEVVPGAEDRRAGRGLARPLKGGSDQGGVPAGGQLGGGAGGVRLDDEGADAPCADALKGFEAAGRSGLWGVEVGLVAGDVPLGEPQGDVLLGPGVGEQVQPTVLVQGLVEAPAGVVVALAVGDTQNTLDDHHCGEHGRGLRA